MKIAIAERLRPFSHTPGSACIIPGTWWQLQAFPTLLRLSHGSQRIDLTLKLTGPVRDFTLQQDLERGVVWIFGRAKEGYFRFRLEASDAGFDLYAEKSPGIITSKGALHAKDRLHIPAELNFSLPQSAERLSLGSHKEQDWDATTRRADLKELIPPLLCLAQKIPVVPPQSLAMSLPEKNLEKNQIEPLLESLFLAGFTDILVPRLTDDQHQGIAFIEAHPEAEPCFLIQQAARWIRSLFFIQNERRLQILPLLPPSFDSGRFLHLECPGIGTLAFEWSKFLLRRAIVHAKTPGEVLFDLQRGIESFRVRTTRWEKGHRQKATEPLLVERGKVYFIDRIEK